MPENGIVYTYVGNIFHKDENYVKYFIHAFWDYSPIKGFYPIISFSEYSVYIYVRSYVV